MHDNQNICMPNDYFVYSQNQQCLNYHSNVKGIFDGVA